FVCTVFFLPVPPPPRSTLFPYTTLFRSFGLGVRVGVAPVPVVRYCHRRHVCEGALPELAQLRVPGRGAALGHHSRVQAPDGLRVDRKSTRLNSSHEWISYAVFCLKKKNK